MRIRLKTIYTIIGVCLILLGSFSAGYILGLGPLYIWTTEHYRVPEPIFNENTLAIPYGTYEAKSFQFQTGDETIIDFSVSESKIIDFFVLDEDNYNSWQNNQTTLKHLYAPRTMSVNSDFTVPHGGKWYFVWDNTFTNTETKQIQQNIQIIVDLPFHGAIIDRFPAFIFSTIITILGAAIIAYNIIRKDALRQTSTT